MNYGADVWSEAYRMMPSDTVPNLDALRHSENLNFRIQMSDEPCPVPVGSTTSSPRKFDATMSQVIYNGG